MVSLRMLAVGWDSGPELPPEPVSVEPLPVGPKLDPWRPSAAPPMVPVQPATKANTRSKVERTLVRHVHCLSEWDNQLRGQVKPEIQGGRRPPLLSKRSKIECHCEMPVSRAKPGFAARLIAKTAPLRF